MTKMTNIGDHLDCPKCGRKASVVWISQDRKRLAIRCTGSHSHEEESPSTTGNSYYQTKLKKKAAKRMVFLMKATKE